MKTIIIIIALLSSSLIYSQTISDSTQTRDRNQEREKNQGQTQNQEMNMNQNQIGPNSDAQAQGNIEKNRKDVFIDKDGDGICDTRQSGMSFNKMRKRMGSGKTGPKTGGGGSDNSNGYNGGR